MIETGEPFLDDASIEFKRMEDIDVFNNAITWAFHTGIWKDIGKPTHIMNDRYATSPWVATMFKQERSKNDY